jgi:hypothetical protein
VVLVLGVRLPVVVILNGCLLLLLLVSPSALCYTAFLVIPYHVYTLHIIRVVLNLVVAVMVTWPRPPLPSAEGARRVDAGDWDTKPGPASSDYFNGWRVEV